MSEKIGVKELNEAMVGSLEMGLLIFSLAKDGFQITDPIEAIKAFNSNPKFAAALLGIKEISKEANDLDITEISELAKTFLDYLPLYVKALSKA